MLLALGFEESVSLGIHVAQYLDLWHPDWEPVSVEMSGMGLGLAASTMHGCLCPCGATVWCGYGQSLDLHFSISKIGLSLLWTWAATSHIDPSRIAALDEPFVGVTSVKTDHSNPSEAFLPHAKKKSSLGVHS